MRKKQQPKHDCGQFNYARAKSRFHILWKAFKWQRKCFLSHTNSQANTN